MSQKSGGDDSLAQGGEAAPGRAPGPTRGLTPSLVAAAAVSIAVLAALLTGATPLLRGPAPHLPEWRWGGSAGPTRPLTLAALVAAALVALVATAGGRWWRSRPRASAAALLAAATVGGFSFSAALLDPAGIVRAGAVLGALGLAAASVLTVWPLAWLAAGLGRGPIDAARLAAPFVLLPGPALLAGSLDAALALPVTASAAILLAAARDERPARSLLAAAGAGVAAAPALLGSQGGAAFLAIAGLAVGAAVARDRASAMRFARAAAAAALVALVLALGLPALIGPERTGPLAAAPAVHLAEPTPPRGSLRGLAFDLGAFALYAGLPFALRALGGLGGWRRRAGLGAGGLDRFRIAAAAGIALLAAAGVTRGEVGRPWIPLVPLVLLAAAREDEPSPVLTVLVPAAIAAAFTLAMAGRWSL